MHHRLTFCSCLFLALISLQSRAETIDVVTEDSSYAYPREGKLVGPGTLVVEQTLNSAVLADFRIGLYPWARAYEKALREPNVLIFPLDRTPAREHLFKWVGEIDRVITRFYKVRGREGISVNSLEDAKRYSVGVVRNDSKQVFLQQHGFSRLVISANNRDNFQKLLNQQVQLIPMPESSARQISEAEGVAFSSLEEVYSLDDHPHRVYMAFSRGTADEIVTRAQEAFEQLRASGEVARIMGQKR